MRKPHISYLFYMILYVLYKDIIIVLIKKMHKIILCIFFAQKRRKFLYCRGRCPQRPAGGCRQPPLHNDARMKINKLLHGFGEDLVRRRPLTLFRHIYA